MSRRRKAAVAAAILVIAAATSLLPATPPDWTVAMDSLDTALFGQGPPTETVSLPGPPEPPWGDYTLFTPNDLVLLAWADSQTLPAHEASYWRYLSIANVPPTLRPDYIKAIDLVANSLSQRKVIRYCTVVPGSEFALVRIRLDDYAMDREVYERLGLEGSGPEVEAGKNKLPEPWFHTLLHDVRPVTKRIVKGEKKYYKTDWYQIQGHWYDTKWYYDEQIVEEKGQSQDVLVYNETLDTKVAELGKYLGTDFPLLRADYFMCLSLLAPRYYEFHGVKNLDDMLRAARADTKRDEDIAARGIVTISEEVAINQRGVLFTPTPLGLFSETYDYFSSLNERDLLQNLLNKKRDGGEFIWNLANRLQGYGVTNAKGDAVAFADPHLAADTRNGWTIKAVWTCHQCIWCHDKGLRPVSDEVRLLSNPKVQLLVKDYADYLKVADLYDGQITEPVDRGQLLYRHAVLLATRGWEPPVMADKMQRIFLTYMQEPVTLDSVQWELGYTKEQIRFVLAHQKGGHASLAQLYAGRPVRPDVWARHGYGQLLLLLHNAERSGLIRRDTAVRLSTPPLAYLEASRHSPYVLGGWGQHGRPPLGYSFYHGFCQTTHHHKE